MTFATSLVHQRLQLPGARRCSPGSRSARLNVISRAHGRFFIGGNWKCNGTVESVTQLVKDLNAGSVPPADKVEIVVAPTFVHLDMVKKTLNPPFEIGAQDCWVGKGGAFTGEVSAEMLHDFGIPWVILGHSERRSLCREDDELVGQKCEYALSQGLKVIGCIGETLAQRESGHMFDVLDAQLRAIANHTSLGNWVNMVIAYEPVWAIGTGVVATPEQAQEAHAYVRKWISDNVSPDVAADLRLLYGGSVNESNCGTLANLEDVDGFLVGGASLQGASFISICNAENKHS
ncbi:triosephosphate isomerase chloroplast type [Chlorella variabilis]|uniref:Triosephosphate isomerase chloroplast type n=1 Tax=Chlorella variabilis TaxID=554065 RepID=E1ZJ95_CHLVA|nr:triosephosphate isomerase chloroplast type [Chlorella variabilis]EFN54097.1 triosephosphate isomerase chloroplast type [Chlorella variabilis]|eukprot:XP_005846199.1 triosephosphate isomerase chloroplast type [Chlorella variabilis]